MKKYKYISEDFFETELNKLWRKCFFDYREINQKTLALMELLLTNHIARSQFREALEELVIKIVEEVEKDYETL